MAFAYFYTYIAFNPAQQADIIRKQGGYIPGIKPGPETERYLTKVVNRITLPGAMTICRNRWTANRCCNHLEHFTISLWWSVNAYPCWSST